ncbi:hypothetical protein [Mitsuokella sp. AF21-1AC]|uniref:hypothetical protein n=1 Tax=Mitsuokella sp. AF21-1AC TaxID=2292235 RepID=UPI0011CC6399|nr:hypothetical protein [Mitsuokella sp. AF21-1AC]
MSFVLARQLKDLFRPSGAPSPCAGYDACEDLQLSFVLARQLMDLFRLASSAPSPCAGKAARLAALVSYEGYEPERRDVFRLEARGDCPQGWGPIRKDFAPDVGTPRQAAKPLCCSQHVGPHLAAC